LLFVCRRGISNKIIKWLSIPCNILLSTQVRVRVKFELVSDILLARDSQINFKYTVCNSLLECVIT